MDAAVPTLSEICDKSVRFAMLYGPDPGPPRLAGDTDSDIDLSAAATRADLLRWLNSWGCRLPYPRPGEPDLFDSGVAAWWRGHRQRLPRRGLADLADAEIADLGVGFDALAGLPVTSGGRTRRVGPTAAAKVLYALRPHAVMPWDAAIAVAVHGARDGAAFARHQALARRWARSLLAAAQVGEPELPAALGRPGTTLPKILDDFCYLTYTRGE